MKTAKQWRGSTGGTPLGQKLLLLMFRYIDLRTAYAIMAVVVPFYMLFHHRATRAILHYFRQRRMMGPAQSLAHTYANHFMFGQMILDRFAVFSGCADIFRVNITGNEHFLRLASQPQGFIIAGAHIGNFEIAGYLLRQNLKPLHALVYPGETKTVQRNRSRVLAQNNISLIPVAPDMSHLIAIRAALSAGGVVIMPADRMYGSSRSALVRFLGAPAHFPIGAASMAITFGVEILAVYAMKSSARRYDLRVIPIPTSFPGITGKQERITAITAAFAESMTAALSSHPEQWFNYYPFWEGNSH
ncbi:MAG: lipid A biosynthesis (KDO)2-(lauroyl)-lipid IVA acyltransferase [Tannerellaceae bacterium]|nr:lipid A biosynthesis (KDO)2-(lauroyl)-lipid IVA acyltransferase [Tannerellaceae bacterium]